MARAEANSVAPFLNALTDFVLPSMPARARTSQNIRSINRDHYSDEMPLVDALTNPWLTLDTPRYRNAICIDVDHPDIYEKLLSLPRGCPRPHVVFDPWSGRSHAFLMLKSPVLMGEGSALGPQFLFNLAGRLMATALDGTLMPHKGLIKSPWGQTKYLQGQRLKRGPQPESEDFWLAYEEAQTGLMWQTTIGDLKSVELRAILASLADEYPDEMEIHTQARFKRRKCEPSDLGRNCALFDVVRWWCYETAETDACAIQDYAEQINIGFPVPLPPSDVRATARSIARFMRNRYRPRADGATRNRGRDSRYNSGLDTVEKQRLSALKSAEARTARNIANIDLAVKSLVERKFRVTQSNVAKESGLSERTVRKYWSDEKRKLGALSDSRAKRSSSSDFLKEKRRINKAIKFYEKIIGVLSERNATPVSIEFPIGFQRLDKSHHVIFELFATATLLNDRASRTAERREKALEAKVRKLERETWHATNRLLPYADRRCQFDARINSIRAEYDEKIEYSEGDAPHWAKTFEMAKRSVLRAEWQTWRRALQGPRPAPAPHP